MKKRPRFIQCMYAFIHGYFWLPCPLCGEKFGGHEWAKSLDSIYTGGNRGVGVCSDCGEEAKRINMSRYGHP